MIDAAIGPENGRVSLSNPADEAWAIQTVRNEQGDVIMRSIPDLVRGIPHAKLFLIKIDIEGFESDLFAKNTEWLLEPEVVIVEPHDWVMPGKGTSKSLQKTMGELDFEILIAGENLIFVRRPIMRPA